MLLFDSTGLLFPSRKLNSNSYNSDDDSSIAAFDQKKPKYLQFSQIGFLSME